MLAWKLRLLSRNNCQQQSRGSFSWSLNWPSFVFMANNSLFSKPFRSSYSLCESWSKREKKSHSSFSLSSQLAQQIRAKTLFTQHGLDQLSAVLAWQQCPRNVPFVCMWLMVFMYTWKKVIWILGDCSVYLPCILVIEITEKISIVLLDIYLQSTYFRLYVEVDISWYF